MYPIKQSTAITVPFFVHDASGDAVTGLTDGSFTKRISKNGAAFGAMTVTISEMENGWYSIPLSTAHSDTAGLLSITFTNAGAKQVNLQFRVHASLPDDIGSDTAVIEVKTSDTHSRLVVVETAIDSDQTSRATAISDVKSAVAVLDAAVDSDQTSRATAISDVKSELVIISAAVATLDAAVDSDQLSRTAAISDVKSELVIVSAAVATLDAAVDSDQTSRAAAVSDIKSELVIISGAVAALDSAVDSDQLSRTAAISDVHSRLVVVESSVDSDQTSRTTAISDVKSQLTLVEAVTTALGATAAAQLNLSANQIIAFTVDTVTNTHTPTTTEFQADDITEATADHYNGRIVIFTSGALAGQATDITDYQAVGGIGQFTVTAMTEAPANNDTGIIL